MKGASFGRESFETLKHRVTCRLDVDTLSRNIATSDRKVISGHERSPTDVWQHALIDQVMTLTLDQIFKMIF